MAAGILCGIMTGAAIGVINGMLITWFRVFPFIATLAMMSVLSGLALSISGGTPITGLPPEFTSLAYTRVGGVPLPLIVSVTVLVLVFLFLHYLRLGRHMYAVGGNRQAAILSGLNVSAITVTAYAMCSLCAAVGAIILSARVGSGQPSLGGSLPLESVAAVVLGGVSLFGGSRINLPGRCRRGVCQYSVEWTESAERQFVHANDDCGRHADRRRHIRPAICREVLREFDALLEVIRKGVEA